MKIEYIDVDLLRKYNNNAKDHPESQVNEIAKSIERFGFWQPIAVDRNYVIVIGHGRMMAAKKLGIKQVPVTVIDDLTDDEINALRLVDNKLNESGWDFSALEAELSTITGIDMSDFGFQPISDEEIEYVTRQPERPQERGWHEDEEEYTPTAHSGEYGASTGTVQQQGQIPRRDEEVSPYEGGYEDEYGRPLNHERNMVEVMREEQEYRYVCPRCKHRFN